MALADEFRREVMSPVSSQPVTPKHEGIPWCAPDPRDTWAPFRGEHICLDRAGRWRGRHGWVRDDCVFCGRRKGGMAAEER